MARIDPWLPRAGAAIAAASFFLPQYSAAGRLWSPFGLCMELGDHLPLSGYLYHVLWMVSWLILPLLLLAGTARRTAGSGLEWVLLVLLLAASFALSTFASILLTTVEADAGPAGVSTGLGLALFAFPPVLAAVAVARVLGGGDRRVTAGLVRASLGLLLALHAFMVAGSWWGSVPGSGGTGRTLLWAWAPVAGALLVVAGEVRLLLRASAAPPASAPTAA